MKEKQTLFQELAGVFDRLEHTSSNFTMVNILAGFLPKLSPSELKMTSNLLQGKIGPAFEKPEFGLAQKQVLRIVSKAFMLPEQKVQKLFFKTGDLGTVAEQLSRQNGRRPTIRDVFESLEKITKTSGKGSMQAKTEQLAKLLAQVGPKEAKYIIRIVLGKLRIGVADMTFLSALAKGFTGKIENKEVLESAYNVRPDLGEIAFLLAKKGLSALKRIKPTPGIPIQMMLASRVKDLTDIPVHLRDDWFVEYKYDGERMQLHKNSRGSFKIFSRRLENITSQYPEIVELVEKDIKASQIITEGEIVAINPKTKKLESFQTLMRRKRKHNIAQIRTQIPIVVFLFDLLFINGKSLLGEALAKRRKLLGRHVTESGGMCISQGILAKKLGEVENYFHKALAFGAEGIMVKGYHSPYQPGRRGWYWIKFKKEHHKELADTFDVVIVGALHGRGRRTGSYGSLLVASYDPKTNKYYSLTKVGTGFTDQDLRKLPKILKPYIIPQKHRLVNTNMQADVWLEPAKVVEISGAELTISPVHTVAKDKLKKGGLALRFPKFIRFREDKSPEQATTVEEIWEMYKAREK